MHVYGSLLIELFHFTSYNLVAFTYNQLQICSLTHTVVLIFRWLKFKLKENMAWVDIDIIL